MVMALLSIYTQVGYSPPEPSTIVLRPSPIVSYIPNGKTEPPLCWLGSELSPCPIAPMVSASPGSGNEADSPVPLAPMPFATPPMGQPIAPIDPTEPTPADLRSPVPEVSAPSMTPPPDRPTSSAVLPLTSDTSVVTGGKADQQPSSPPVAIFDDPMMHGNPEPKHIKLHVPVIIGVVIVCMLGSAIIPLLIFSLVMKIKLRKAIERQVADGRRAHMVTGFGDPEEMRRDHMVDDKFMAMFRKRVHNRAFLGRSQV